MDAAGTVEKLARERRARRLLARIAPSAYVKDLTIGGVAFVAVRITFIYLKALSTKPELLASMGPKLIVDILGVCILGVLANRFLDLFGTIADKFVSAFEGAMSRMAQSSERTAASTAETAAAQQAGALAQRDLAEAQRQQTAVMERVAATGDRQLTEVQTVQTYQVNQGHIFTNEIKRIGVIVERIAEHVGMVKRPHAEEV